MLGVRVGVLEGGYCQGAIEGLVVVFQKTVVSREVGWLDDNSIGGQFEFSKGDLGSKFFG